MKKNIHPTVNPVVFIDTSCNVEFFTTSTLRSEKTREVDGVKYFEIPIEISSASHPFFTGKQVLVDTARRVEKFKEKMEKQSAAADARKGKKAKRTARATKREATEK
ncbi:MAG: type B 50S ribosomal protein L31 [Candidatus Magasanikbacteria bacterium]